MDYKAAWEDLKHELEITIETDEKLAKRQAVPAGCGATTKAFKSVVSYMKHTENAAKPDVDAKA